MLGERLKKENGIFTTSVFYAALHNERCCLVSGFLLEIATINFKGVKKWQNTKCMHYLLALKSYS